MRSSEKKKTEAEEAEDSSKVTFDAEEAFTLGYIPLDKLQANLKKLINAKGSCQVQSISFGANGYCTDAVLRCIATTLKDVQGLDDSLQEINLLGCGLITDSGLCWLASLLREKCPKSYLSITLDGCSRITDSGVVMLKMACPDCQLSAMATSIVHLRYLANASGCPLLLDPTSLSLEKEKKAQVVIVPLKTKDSLATYLPDKTCSSRKPLHYVRETPISDWSLNLLEIDPETPLFEHLVPPNPIQVVIPFSASLEPTEVVNHIADTISLVLSKETINPEHPSSSSFHSKNSTGFIHPFTTQMCRLSNDGVFKSLTSSENVLGMMVSRQPLSRSNPFFEVECLGDTKPADTGFVMGCMHDVLMTERFPMESKERSGGAVEGFEIDPGKKYGFGVEGDWLSEYVPGTSSVYYFTKNGEKITEKAVSEKPHVGMYPMVSVLGKIQASAKISHFNSMPQELLLECEQKQQHHTRVFTHNVMCDEDGIISYCDNYQHLSEVGLFMMGEEITKVHNSCSIKILSLGKSGTITLGIGPEKYPTGSQPGWRENSIAFHGDDGKVYLQQSSSASAVPCLGKFKVGDVVKVTVNGFQGDSVNTGDTLTVTFYLNEKESQKFELSYKAVSGVRCLFVMGMHSKGEKAQLLNYRPLYLPVSPHKRMLTMGRSHYTNIMDDGTLTYRKFDRREFYGLYVSKTPFSSELAYFEVEVVKMTPRRHLGVGLCDPFYPCNQMLGWRQGSLGYHADNGQVYQNTSSGYKPNLHVKDGMLNEGDVVGCGIDLSNAKLKPDGSFQPQQTLTVYFTKNGTRVHERKFEYMMEGMYPAVNLHFEGDEVKLHNYNSSPESVRAFQQPKEEKKKPEDDRSKEKRPFTEGCHFMVVGMSSDGTDPSGKTQLVQQMFNPESELSALKHIKTEISRLESNLGSLDLQSQQRYSQLLWQQECIERFIHNKRRLSFCSLDTKSGKGHSEIVAAITDILEMDLEFHSKAYEFHSCVSQYLGSVLQVVKAKEVLVSEDLFTLVDHSPLGGNGRLCEKTVHFLQKKGYLTTLPWKNTMVALDMAFVLKLTDSVNQCPNKPLKTAVPMLGDMACVWDSEIQIYNKASDYSSHQVRLLRWALQYFGVMRVPNVRMSTNDQLYIFFTLGSLGTAPVTLEDFRKGNGGKNMVVMQRTYHFLHSLSDSLLAFILTRCARFSRPVLLRQDGGVFQSGAVQNVVRKCFKGRECQLVLESFCYMPEGEGAALNQETRSHVAEYTWHIFCILLDIIDVMLIRLNIPVIVSHDCPPDLVNNSIGCIHDWHSLMNEDDRQTVCSLCNMCCEHGSRCERKDMPCQRLRQSSCATKVTGCKDCGICKFCADELWTIRTFLRPCCEVSSHEKSRNQRVVPLNSTTFDEVSCTSFSAYVTPFCLQKTEGGSESYIQVFPGPAVEIPNKRLGEYNEQTNFGHLCFKQGDTITVKLEPLKMRLDHEEEEEEEAQLEIKPVYYTLLCRECRIWHDTGVICYSSPSTSVPVSQFVGERALTKECNKFSIEIVNEGNSRYVAIGVCPRRYTPNRQPGWDSGSVGYHADDGGIFLGSGWPTTRKAKYYKGDVITCELDFEELKVKFYKNDVLVYTTNRQRVPAGGYHPCVGMHSVGEAVRLLQKEPWQAAKEEDGQIQGLPDAFDCYKYGNLWISPGNKVPLVKKGQNLTGWAMLHNPSRSLVGYQVEPLKKMNRQGTLKAGETITFYMQFSASEMPTDQALTVRWLQLDSGRDYTQDDLTVILQSATLESLLEHRLAMKVFNTQQTDVTQLKKVSESPPDPSTRYMMQVIKNGILVEKYWLKGGNFSAMLPFNTSAILTYPKFPTLDTANVMSRGMRLVAEISKDVYAECVVVSVMPDRKTVTLEYSEANQENNSQVDLPVSSPIIQLKEIPYETIVRVKIVQDIADGNAPETANGGKEKEKESETTVQAALEIMGYSARGNIASAKSAYMFAPFHLLSEASQQAIKALDPNWLRNSLQSVAACSKVATRITVQELQITALARKPSTWVNGNNALKSRIGETFTCLPSALDWHKVCYPIMPDMFTDIDVHRLCMLVDQEQILGWEEKNIDEPIHFVDIPPIKPATPLPDELMYACMLSGWTYTALIAKKLLLPLYDMIFSGGKPDVPRAQLESGMTSLLSVYASLCNLYAEQCGGLEYQMGLEEGTKTITKAIAHQEDGTHLKTAITVATIPDPHCLFKRNYFNHGKVCFTTVCKAHLFAIEPVLLPDGASYFSLEYFQPYGETLNAFERALHEVKALPPNFFAHFPNLQVLYLQECNALTEVPPNISQCRQLEKMVVTDSQVTALPADLFEIPELMVLVLRNLPLTSLPSRVPTSSWLTHLVLRGLQLREVPPALGNLTELLKLDLNQNLLTTLPMELQKLQRLRVLKLCGMPWVTVEGNKNSLPLDKYSSWFDERPYLRTFLGKEMILKLFTEFDHNKNAMLDTDEIAHLNVRLFWDVPRIGSTNINDEEYGGIPPVVFTLAALEELRMDFQAVTAVPQHMCRLQSLAYLSLAHNPLLESLPGSLGHLPSLKKIRLVSCPSMRTPPNEVVNRGVESVKAYLKRLAGGFTECRRTKLMFVGLGGAGKTSLLRALMSGGKKTEGTKGEDITDGIIIQPWTVKDDQGVEVTYSTWDFAGQTLYYNTHQFFLSKRAVYLLLWSTRQGFEHAGLDFWLSSVASHAPNTPIFVVGTHCDQVPKADIPIADLKERYPQIAGFHFVSSVAGTGIADLEKDLLRVTLEQKNMGEKVPQVWLSLEKKILQARTKSSILEWKAIKEYGMDIGIYDEKDTKEAIQFLHELGTVQYFDNDFLRNIVVINPQWIVNVMACVVSVKNSPIQDHQGRLLHKFIPQIWNSYPNDLHQWLLRLTEEFDLTFPLPKDKVNIVPCLLPQEEPEELQWPSIEGQKRVRETKMMYKFAYLPAGLFNRAQVRLFQFSDGKLIWKRGSLLKKNRHLALIKQISDCELLVKVQGPRPENIVFLVHEVIESLIEESFHGVQYDFLLPCPDCVTKEGTLDPSLFEGSLVKNAKDHRAPFLQCRKYFHTISMSQLQEVMPAESASDFDAHLQHSIMSLQQMNSAMAKDIAVLYSAWDIPANNENDKVHPAWLKEDLEKQGAIDGYTCWFPEDVANASVEEMMIPLKHCKVVVALVSDNFERDKKSNDLLMYTMDTLHKPYLIVVIRPGQAWAGTDLGMRIGKQEIMVMIKTKDRYKSKVHEDLFPKIQEKLKGVRMMMVQPPVCFLSYCWSNSRDAQSKGTLCPPSALGWGDPRDIKQFLEKHGVSCWMDTEQITSGGLFKNITQGMRQAQVLVACVSDQYIKSENCMMELRFGVLTLNLPLVICVVGTGREWKMSEVGILMHRSQASKVYFQSKSEGAYESLLTYVKDRLSLSSEQKVHEEVKQHMKELKEKDDMNKPDKTSFNEEYELTQRKFMRHIISYISSTDPVPMPRLLVVDFDKPMVISRTSRQMPVSEEGSGDSPRPTSSRPGLRPKTATRTRDRMEPVNLLDDEENWEAENFCLKLLCENEEGWHLCPKTFPIKLDDTFQSLIRHCSAYLARLYAILQQSSVHLNCFVGKRGKKYRQWIEESAVETPNFTEAFSTIRMQLSENQEADSFMQQLCRCHLPSGKTYWLCGSHQDGPRITKLSTESASRDDVRRVLFEEDLKLRELMEASAVYRKHKAQTHMQSSVILPAKSMSSFGKAKAPKPGNSEQAAASTSKETHTADAPSSSSAASPAPGELQRKKSMKSTASVASVVSQGASRREGNGKNKSSACSLQ